MDTRFCRTSVLAAIVLLGVAAPGAAAKTVGGAANGSTTTVTEGQALHIKLRPADSGSSGYHWRVAKRPSSLVLNFRSDKATRDGRYQQFTYDTDRGNGGTASLKLQYVPPGRHRKPTKSFTLRVLVISPAAAPACPGSRDASVVAHDDKALVFRARRTTTVRRHPDDKLITASYDAYYGCLAAEGSTAYPLPPGGPEKSSPTEHRNLTLRGTAVAFVYQVGSCTYDGDCFDTQAPFVVSVDLSTGKLIRRVYVGASGPGEDNEVSALVVSESGGVAWIERGRDPEGVATNYVRRSDTPGEGGAPFTGNAEVLDDGTQGLVDPDSLYFDGTQISWQRAGETQHASLR